MEMAAVVASHGPSLMGRVKVMRTLIDPHSLSLSLNPALLVVRSRDMTHEGYFTSSSPMILSHAIFVASCPVRLHCWGMGRKRLDQATIVCVTKWMFVQRPSSDSGSSDLMIE